jgi:hypothetical protein
MLKPSGSNRRIAMAAQMPAQSKQIRRTSRKTQPRAHTPGLVNGITTAVISQIIPARIDLIPESVRRDMIAEAAYFLAEHRGFQPGHDAEDWHQAEAEIDDIISRRYSY